MKRVRLAASGLMLSCLLAACGGGTADTPTQEATAHTETAQAAVTRQAHAARRPAPEQFTGRLREVDETLVWQQTETTVANTNAQRTYSDHVTAVNADGSFAFERLNGAGNVFERYTSDVNGSRLTRQAVPNGTLCSFNPGRNFVNFPLYVGKVWMSNWTQSCTLGYQETVKQLTAVTGRETIAITAGNHDALRLNYVTLITKSNDVNLQNGSTGEAAYLQEATCWWSTAVKRIVKCSYKNNYFGSTPPASYLKSYTFEASFIGKQYFPAAKISGQRSAWSETETLFSGNTFSRNYTQTVGLVNADGSYSATRFEASGAMGETTQFDIGDNRLARAFASSSNSCTYSPKRDYFNFPLYVGKTWSSNWLYRCVNGYHDDAAHTARVEALETVTTPAGSFEAVRVRFETRFTNSNDLQLENGATGQAMYGNDGVCWWSTALKRMVKCEVGFSYVGAAPPQYRRLYVTEMTAALLP